ncbi:TPA: hypothetical protein SML50_004459 [Serratia fonticola]|uniref:hypothetical protein n=1 Tax=Serratia fonticola TaxID=47917 RepID=UPI0029F0A800|nr:hypothetical protein [Serratia fonticola]
MINLHRMAAIITYLTAKNRGDYHGSSMSDGFSDLSGGETFGGIVQQVRAAMVQLTARYQ